MWVAWNWPQWCNYTREINDCQRAESWLLDIYQHTTACKAQWGVPIHLPHSPPASLSRLLVCWPHWPFWVSSPPPASPPYNDTRVCLHRLTYSLRLSVPISKPTAAWGLCRPMKAEIRSFVGTHHLNRTSRHTKLELGRAGQTSLWGFS